MTDDNYLLKVLGLSVTPKIFTFILKLISFPLMIRALGASKYGIVVYISAVIAIFESFVDFGVSSAAGKGIATARETGSAPLGLAIMKWARLQAAVAFSGLAPLLAVSYFLASVGAHVQFSLLILVLLVLAAWIQIFFNFSQACLTSVLAFGPLALLNTISSILRSVGWLAVAFFMPSVLGLAAATLVCAVCSAALSIWVLWRFVKKYNIADSSIFYAAQARETFADFKLGQMIKESLSFLWLRMSTRVYQGVPSMIFARMFGAEVVGIVGSIGNMTDIICFPFSVIGNALAVRAPGVMSKGLEASTALWDAALRFIAVPIMLSVSVYLSADFLARLLLPDDRSAAVVIAIMSVTVLTTAVSSVIAPMSDYVGGLRSRNILITFFAAAQIPLIWSFGHMFGLIAAISTYVLIHVLKNSGYIIIALKVFFRNTRYCLRPEMRYFLIITGPSLLFACTLADAVQAAHILGPQRAYDALLKIALFWAVTLGGLLLHRSAKRFFITRRFLEFQG